MKKIAILFPSLILASNIQTIEFKGLIHLSPLTAKSLITIRENEEYDIDALKPNTTLKDGKYIIKKKLK